jgi:RNA polymerase sigma-70 factor (ECF subfamily)
VNSRTPAEDVSARTPAQRGERDRTPTLGDLLYTDRTTGLVPERDWVGLVRGIAEGDQRALHTLYERSHRLVFTLMLRITGSRETAEELTVDVFHDVWRRASTYDAAGGTVVGWIMNQARSRAIDRVRFDQRKKRVDHHAGGPPPAPSERGPDEAAELSDQARRLREALMVLTADERQAIETAFFSELTYDEAAARLAQPLGTVKTRIRSGLGKLRQALGQTVKRP